MVGLDQQICAGLGAAVGAAWVKGSLLREEQIRSVQGKVTVDLVCGYLVEAPYAEFPAGIQQHLSAEDVGFEKDLRLLDRAVHMRLCRKIHHSIGLFLLEESVNGAAVADVGLHEAETWLLHYRSKGREISGVGQLVDTDDPAVRVAFQHIENEV